MPTETESPPERLPISDVRFDEHGDDDRTHRQIAVKHLHQVRSFKLHVLAYLVGIPVIGVVWILTEYLQENTWPSRFADSDDGNPGTWNPWIFWVIGVWSVVLLVDAVKTFARRPPSEAEIQREIDRMKSGG
jgi:hypothetical protein